MPQPSAETARLQFLDDTLRQRFPGFIDETSDVSGKPSGQEQRRLPDHEHLEQAIGNIVKKRIPAHPAYNVHILNTLRIFRANNIAAMGPQNRKELLGIVNSAHKKRPVFPGSFDRDTFLYLHTLLKNYSEIKGGDLRQLPSIETLGYRLDEARLRKFDRGQTLERAPGRINLRYAEDDLRDQNIAVTAPGDHREDGTSGPPDVWIDKPEGLTSKLQLRKQQLRELNQFIDTVCPSGKYFNSMRQQIIHQVWSNRKFFEDYKATLERNKKNGWDAPGHTVKNGQIVNHNFVWMPEDKWTPMKEFIDSMNKMLVDKKNELITAAGRHPQPLTPEEAVEVDQHVCRHVRLRARHAAQRGAGQAAREGPPNADRMPTGAELAPGQIPEAIKRAVTQPYSPVRTNPVAEQWAQRCAKTIEEIVPFKNRATLEKRLRLQRLAFESRAKILATGSSDELERIFHTQMKNTSEAFGRLARQMNSFNEAWVGKLREPPPAEGAAATTRKDVSPPRKPHKVVSAFQSKALISAAQAPGQRKLSFPTLSGLPLPPPAAVPFVPPQIGPPREVPAHSLKRKRGDVGRIKEDTETPTHANANPAKRSCVAGERAHDRSRGERSPGRG